MAQLKSGSTVGGVQIASTNDLSAPTYPEVMEATPLQAGNVIGPSRTKRTGSTSYQSDSLLRYEGPSGSQVNLVVGAEGHTRSVTSCPAYHGCYTSYYYYYGYARILKNGSQIMYISKYRSGATYSAAQVHSLNNHDTLQLQVRGNNSSYGQTYMGHMLIKTTINGGADGSFTVL
jgi:hypothetical protein